MPAGQRALRACWFVAVANLSGATSSQLPLLATAEHRAIFLGSGFTLFAAAMLAFDPLASVFRLGCRRRSWTKCFEAAGLLFLFERTLVAAQMRRQRFGALFSGSKDIGRQAEIGLLRRRFVWRYRFDRTRRFRQRR